MEQIINENGAVENEAKVVIEKVGIVQQFKELPTWKKVLIGAGLGVGAYFGYKGIKAIIEQPDIVADVVDASVEGAKESVKEVF